MILACAKRDWSCDVSEEGDEDDIVELNSEGEEKLDFHTPVVFARRPSEVDMNLSPDVKPLASLTISTTTETVIPFDFKRPLMKRRSSFSASDAGSWLQAKTSPLPSPLRSIPEDPAERFEKQLVETAKAILRTMNPRYMDLHLEFERTTPSTYRVKVSGPGSLYCMTAKDEHSSPIFFVLNSSMFCQRCLDEQCMDKATVLPINPKPFSALFSSMERVADAHRTASSASFTGISPSPYEPRPRRTENPGKKRQSENKTPTPTPPAPNITPQTAHSQEKTPKGGRTTNRFINRLSKILSGTPRRYSHGPTKPGACLRSISSSCWESPSQPRW